MRFRQNLAYFGIGSIIIVLGHVWLDVVVPKAAAQELVWERTNGLYGGNVQTLFATPNGTLYAGTWGNGVFRSNNSGNLWEESSVGLTNLHVSSLSASGPTLYAGTSGGVFRSNDGGNSWTPAGLRNRQVNSLLVSESTLYAGTSDGIFRSDDSGESWIERDTRTYKSKSKVYVLAASGAILYAGLEFSAPLRSEDGGDSWAQAAVPRDRSSAADSWDVESLVASLSSRGGKMS